MIEFSRYDDSPGAPTALAADLARRLADTEAEAIVRDDDAGYAVLRDGRVLDWTGRLDRPQRRTGTVTLDDPLSLADYIRRYRTDDTVAYGDRESGTVEAVFDDHPATVGIDALAGWRSHRAVLRLTTSDEWREWTGRNNMFMTQQQFGEHLDSLAHTVVEPSAATMLEVATTLTGKAQIDYSSRTRLDNGDVSFRFEQEATMRAGRGATGIEIPQSFSLSLRVWNGTDPVVVTARLRMKVGANDGVQMGYKLLRVTDKIAEAFGKVRDLIITEAGDEDFADLSIFQGSAR